jgi:hypothetical protein
VFCGPLPLELIALATRMAFSAKLISVPSASSVTN